MNENENKNKNKNKNKIIHVVVSAYVDMNEHKNTLNTTYHSTNGTTMKSKNMYE